MSLLGVRCDGNRGHENTTTANAKKEKPIMSLFDPWLTTGSGLSLPCGKRGQRIIRQYSVKLKQNITKIQHNDMSISKGDPIVFLFKPKNIRSVLT